MRSVLSTVLVVDSSVTTMMVDPILDDFVWTRQVSPPTIRARVEISREMVSPAAVTALPPVTKTRV